MLELVEKSIENMQIKFEGTNDIDIETFSSVLKNTVSSLRLIADELLDEEQFCKFKIRDVKKGSFIIDIGAFVITNYPQIVSQMPTILSTFKTILDIKKHLAGKEPKEVKQIDENYSEVINNDGQVINVYKPIINIYGSNESLEKNISNIFRGISKDKDRNGIAFQVENENGISSTNFNSLEVNTAKEQIDVSKLVDVIETNTIETTVTVIKLDFYGNSKWQVFFNANRINVDIKDKDFLDRIHQDKISFNGSTKLKVKLRIRYKINDAGLPIEGSQMDYAIMEVLDIIENQHQENMELFN